jgi:hypothetical protein
MPAFINVSFSNCDAAAAVAVAESADAADLASFRIRFYNQSAETQTFVCFQAGEREPTGLVPAWFAMPASSQTTLTFDWGIQYDFVWMESGKLAPGITFTAQEVTPAALPATSQINLTYAEGAFGFADQGQGQPDMLMISCDGTIPLDTASLGIGMAGSATVLMQAQPNMTYTFPPTLNYFMTLADVTQGEIIDPTKLPFIVPLVFPPGIMALTVTCNADGTVTVTAG